jgi:hypothetical protein
MRVADVTYSLISLSLLVLGASSAHAIDVGDVFWLSSNGAGLTVIGTALAQPGVVRIQYRILPENASEFCQRYEQHARLTPQHEKCVAGIINNTPQRTALVNCSARVIVLESGSFAKGGDHFRRSRTDPFVRTWRRSFCPQLHTDRWFASTRGAEYGKHRATWGTTAGSSVQQLQHRA